MIGFHCSHELYDPRRLLDLAAQAHAAGFDAIGCSDHISPWTETGESGYAWSWLGAAMERVPLTFGTVCAPGQRYHPAIVAQKAATLAQMFPGRFWVALGTGQFVNEHVIGEPWRSKSDRQQRLKESADIMRRLWNGETVTTSGLIKTDRAKIYSLPEEPPLIFGAAITDETAQWVGSWADGLLTVAKPPEDLAKTVAAFRRGGGEGKPMRLQSAVAFDAEAAYRNWGHCGVSISDQQDIVVPIEFDRRKAKFDAEAVKDKLRVSDDLEQHRRWIADDLHGRFRGRVFALRRRRHGELHPAVSELRLAEILIFNNAVNEVAGSGCCGTRDLVHCQTLGATS